MSRTVFLFLLCLSAALVLLPLTSRKPGLPASLKADEPAYYLAALSLVHDGDLRCEPKDLERLFAEYPYLPAQNVILATTDGWKTVDYGKPYLFSFLAAPFAALWGANGLVAFNAALLAAMIWMGTLYLRRFNSDALAALFSTGFFLASTAFAYVFWLHPEVLNMFSAMACLYFGFTVGDDGRRYRPWLWPALSGAALAIGVYNKPMLAAIGLPVVFHLLYRRRFAGFACWLAGAALAIGLFAAISWHLVGYPTAYLGVQRAGFNVSSPYQLPEPQPLLASLPPDQVNQEKGRSAGWEWIFRLPDLHWSELSEDLWYFVVGRHTGLFLYQPFALVALVLFALQGWRSAERWWVLGALVLVALFFVIFIPFNWHGGGGFVGNRYFVIAYPAFLFLVGRIRPDWLVVPGFALAGLFLGPLLLSPYGTIVPSPTLQAHVRNHPFQAFPLEHSLREIPGYSGEVRGNVWFRGRRDHVRFDGDEIWFAGGEKAEIWLQSEAPLADLEFEVRSSAPDNPLILQIEDARLELVVAPGERQRVRLSPSRPTRVRQERNPNDFSQLIPLYLYRLTVESATGELPRWRGHGRQFFYLGAALRYRGSQGHPLPESEPAP